MVKFKIISLKDKSIWHSLLPYLIIIIVSTILFRNLLDTYAYTDSYEFFLNVRKDNFINVFIQGGRLVYGILVKAAFTYFDSVEHVKFIRLASFIGGLALLISLYKLLKYNAIESIYALGIVLLFAATPSFNIIILWSATFQITWALLIALFAGILASEYAGKATFLLSVLIGIVALNLYQPAYTIFIIPVFLKWLKNKNHKDVIRPVMIHIITYVFYYIIFKLSMILFALPSLDRGGIDLNFWNSFIWFFKEPFVQATRYNIIFSPKFWRTLMQIITTASIFSVYILWKRMDIKSFKRDNVLMILLIFSFFLLSMLPNFFSVDKINSFRTMNTLFLLITIHFLLGLRKSLHSDSYNLRYFIVPILILASFISADYNVNHGFIDIQKKEFETVRNLVNNSRRDTEKIYVKAPEMQILVKENYVKRVVTDEFGRLSNSSSWVAKPMVTLLFKAKFNKEVNVEFYNGEILKPHEVVFDIGKEYLKYDNI